VVVEMANVSDTHEDRTGFFWPVLRGYRLLIVVASLHFAAAVALGHWAGVPFDPTVANRLAHLFSLLVPLFLLVLLVWKLFALTRDRRPGSPIRKMLTDIGGGLSNPKQILGGILAFLIVSATIAAFSHWKGIITDVHPFRWDLAFAEFDRVLHFGKDPYLWLLPLTGYPLVTTFLNAAYHAWLLVVYFVVFTACFMDRDPARRMTFLLSFIMVFILGGNILATVFSSAGPVYFERLGYGDDFVPLMAMLAEFDNVHPVAALNVQEMLWQGYLTGEGIKGISAMPSMHNASAFLLAFYGYAYARWAGNLLMAFALVILVGSIHLGWHYAVDAYAGFLVAAGCWFGARWLVRKTG
jgi:hypothetical protein